MGGCLPRPAALHRVMDIEAQVALAYRSVLRREADPGGLATYADALRSGRDLAWLIGTLAGSGEFAAIGRAPVPPPPFPLDRAAPMDVDWRCTPAELQALWDTVGATWTGLGQTEPHWSVLTVPDYRAAALDPAALAKFFLSGAQEVERLDAWLTRAGWTPRPDAVCVDYGCGVGRVTRSLARRFGHVRGLDVSAPHLAAARAGMPANVDLLPVRGPGDLAALDGIDVFYSIIALQHSPPPIILDVLRRAFAGLRPGGCAFFQVPTLAPGYAYRVGVPPQDGDMEMHFVPQRAVLEEAYRAGLMVAEIQPDWCIGRLGEWISSTFLLLRP